MFTLQTAIKKLTFESVAQILQSVDPLRTARLSSGVLESPAERLEVSTEKTCLCESRSRGERGGENEDEEFLHVKIPVCIVQTSCWDWKPLIQKNVTTVGRLCLRCQIDFTWSKALCKRWKSLPLPAALWSRTIKIKPINWVLLKSFLF